MRHLISMKDIGKDEILEILEEAKRMEELLNTKRPLKLLEGKI